MIRDDADHYAHTVVNMPPTEIVCKCGARFTGDDPIAQIKAHIESATRRSGTESVE